ncbi:ferrochelatase [Trueperella sp.]|uniref:ferrochelatase n=1 Tax=Trueperella sp. TaxID=2699835 RepID=UPI002632B9F4|nr:ferrochelatase [Trueperella sp.]
MVDAYMLLSYGGPNKPEDVVPFLRNAVAGRGVPDERLAQVGQHYYRFGGKSPINELNAALVDRLRVELAARGDHTPIAVGNRNWHPFGHETLTELYDAGARTVRTLATSAYFSYSSCRQYREDLDRWHAQLAHPDLRLEKVRPFWQTPGFYAAYLEVVREARAAMPDARLVFVTHSIPTAMNATAGPPVYDLQHRQLIERLCAELGEPEWDLAYCSRSGSPHVAWLEPDINDHLVELAASGTRAVIVVPIGFISDHMEVVYDLDVEARATAERLGLGYMRAPTVDASPVFVAQLADLLQHGTTGCPAECCLPTPPAARRANQKEETHDTLDTRRA